MGVLIEKIAFGECWVQRVFHDDYGFEWVFSLSLSLSISKLQLVKSSE